jgi:aspartyl/asparaginyl-tRNA synthetase
VIDDVNFLSIDEVDSYPAMGDMTTVMSRSRTGRDFVTVADMEKGEEAATYNPSDSVWIRGRLSSIRVKGGSCFLVVRQDSFHTVQACFFKDKEDPEGSKKMLNYLKSLTLESMVDVFGELSEADVKSCSVQHMEIKLQRIHSVSKADAMLPFQVEDAARSEEEVMASQETDRPFPILGQVRLWIADQTPSCIMQTMSIIFLTLLYSLSVAHRNFV